MHAMPDPIHKATPHQGAETLTFDAAVRMCTEVNQCLVSGYAQALVIADKAGNVTDRVILELFSVDHATGWAMGFGRADPHLVHSVVLISITSSEAQPPDDLDLFEFETLRATLHSTGLELRDWLVTNGTCTRSLAYSFCPDSAWLDDPPAARSRRLEQSNPGLVDR